MNLPGTVTRVAMVTVLKTGIGRGFLDGFFEGELSLRAPELHVDSTADILTKDFYSELRGPLWG